VDLFVFRVRIPEHVDTLHVALDVVAPERTDMNAATGQLLTVDWQTLVLYPRGARVAELKVKPRLRLPAGWQQGAALHATAAADDWFDYPLTSLATLVDSPVIAGKYFSTTAIRNRAGPPVFVHVAADTSAAATLPAAWQDRIARIVDETGTLFGGYPYREYHFLLSLSDQVGNDGLEHRESSDIRMALAGLQGDANRVAYGYLIPHEYVHSWNGKFALATDLVRPDFEAPQTTELHWVYEGLTRYLNWVLAGRTGLFNADEAHDYVALLAAKVAHRPGRDWRALQDTATASSALLDAPDEWESLRRSVDYYDEALFVWLEVDTRIRQLTRGKRSLDDFCRAFYGPARNPPELKPYTFEDVVSTLNSVAAYDWRRLLRERLDATGADRVPFDGLKASGWTLQYRSSVGSVQAARDEVRATVEERFSIGLLTRDSGEVVDVIPDSPAWRAGIGPRMKITKVNAAAWSPDALRSAIVSKRLTLTVQNGAESFDAQVDGTGARYPYLERSTGDDVMAAILAPSNKPTQRSSR
jgi:predicted metalloprotease with PDZ domain